MKIIPKRVPTVETLHKKLHINRSSCRVLREWLLAGFKRSTCLGGYKHISFDAERYLTEIVESLQFIRSRAYGVRCLAPERPTIYYIDCGAIHDTIIYDTMTNIVKCCNINEV